MSNEKQEFLTVREFAELLLEEDHDAYVAIARKETKKGDYRLLPKTGWMNDAFLELKGGRQEDYKLDDEIEEESKEKLVKVVILYGSHETE